MTADHMLCKQQPYSVVEHQTGEDDPGKDAVEVLEDGSVMLNMYAPNAQSVKSMTNSWIWLRVRMDMEGSIAYDYPGFKNIDFYIDVH